MLRQRFIPIAGLTGFAALLFLWAEAAVIPRPPTQKELARPWVGWFDDRRYFRLTLADGGTGLFADYNLSDTNPKPKLHDIRKWSLNGAELAMDVRPVDSQTRPLTLTAHASATMLHLKLAETNGFTCTALLRPESEVDAAIQSTKREMENYGASARRR